MGKDIDNHVNDLFTVYDDIENATPSTTTDNTPRVIEDKAPTEKNSLCSLLECSGATWAYDSFKYGKHTPYALAIILSALKAMQAIGTNIYGLQKTLEDYELSGGTLITLDIIAIFSNAFATSATRIVSNFKSLVRPMIFLSQTPIDDNLSCLKEEYGRLPLLQETYLVAPDSQNSNNNKLYKVGDSGQLTECKLDDAGQKLINDLYESYNAPDEAKENIRLLDLDLSNCKKLYQAKRKKEIYTQWSPLINFLYWVLITPCAFTAIFSSMVAYLSANTLAEKMSLPESLKPTFAGLIVLSNFFSYCTFNLTNMNEEVKKTCENFSKQKTPTLFETLSLLMNILLFRNRILSITVFFSVFGTCANIGFAYFSMKHLFLMPEFNGASAGLVNFFIIMNMGCSLFSSIFNFSAKAQNLVEKWSAPSNRWPTIINCVFSLIILSDTCINALGAYLGIENITQITIEPPTIAWKNACFAINLLMCISYVFLTFGMARNGSEKTIKWAEDSCAAREKYQSANIEDDPSDSRTPLLGAGMFSETDRRQEKQVASNNCCCC